MRKILGLLMGVGLVHVCAGQASASNSFSLSLNSSSGDGVLSLNLTLASAGEPDPVALQWTLDYPASAILNVSAVEGSASTAARKTVFCSDNRCLVYGLNLEPIKSGVVAIITVQVAATAPAILNFSLANTLGASAQGQPILVTTPAAGISVFSRSPVFPQNVGANLTLAGSLAELAMGPGSRTTINLLNVGATPVDTRWRFFADDGTALPLPFEFPQGSDAAATLLTSSLDQVMAPGATLVNHHDGLDAEPLQSGSAQLFADGKVDGFAILSAPAFKWAAAVPLETRQAESYTLVFDNTRPLATGIVIANLSVRSANVYAILRDETGAPIGTATISLPAQGHDYFMLNERYAVTTDKRGTIEFETPTGGRISVLGVRARGTALTTLPVLADVATHGGAIAHSTFNGGFAGSYYLVNTGAESATFALSFFDDAGSAQQVPLFLPQSGTVTTASVFTETLGPGAMLEIDTRGQDDLPLVQGWARLTTDGNIGGFEVLRWLTYGQEASVPLESRTPESFVVIFDNTFDNTQALTTGVALANLSASPANITATFRDDSGTPIGLPESVSLAAHGHTSFLLPDRHPAAAGQHGTVEFAAPPGIGISVIGLRAHSRGTLTTIPVVAK